jgi:hypothetical protein
LKEPTRYARGSSWRYEVYSTDRKESLIAVLYGLEDILYPNGIWFYFQSFSNFFDGFSFLIFLIQSVNENGYEKLKKCTTMGAPQRRINGLV